LKTILFAWELGANLGHAKPLAAIARMVANAETRIVVAGRELAQAQMAFAGLDAMVLQAPIWPLHHHMGSQTGQQSYLDVLVGIGFADPAKLGAMVAGWKAICDLVKPDVVVADHSPALLVACHTLNIPVVLVGSCFTTPPVDYRQFPPIRADRAPIMPEARVLAAVAAVAAGFGAPAPVALLDCFRTRGRVVFGCTELDPYASFRREPLYTPPESLPKFVEPPVRPRLFVYLGSEVDHIDDLIQALTQINVPIEAYLRGEIAAFGRFLALAGHIVHDEPPPLADVLLNASHVLSEAGAYTSFSALAAGRPQLGFVLHAEADMNITAMERMGCGRRLRNWTDEAGLQHALRAFIDDHSLQRQARHWANILAMRDAPDGLQAAEQMIGRCLGASSSSPRDRLASV
jgi:rhamnosyltransferase subunit B